MAPKRLSWSNLPTELLSIIFKKLTECEDISHCAGVCSSWQSVIKDLYHQLKPILPAFLLLTEVGGLIEYSPPYPNHQSCILFNPETNRTHEIFLPQLKGRWFSSSSFGWILLVDYSNGKNMHLLNPFTRSQIKLPPPGNVNLKGLRVITSTSPLDPNCLVLLVSEYSQSRVGALALCRHGDTIWRMLGGRDHIVADEVWENLYKYNKDCCLTIDQKPKTVRHFLYRCGKRGVVFYKGNCYCIGKCGIIFRIKFDRGYPIAEALSIKKHRSWPHTEQINYLLELNGDLLHIIRSVCALGRYCMFQTSSILVYKIDWKKKRRVEVKNIGNNVILLGRQSCSTFIPRSEDHHFRANCIYFIDDCFMKIPSSVLHNLPPGCEAGSVYDTGIYNMSKRRLEWPYQSPFIPLILGSRNPFNWIKVQPEI